MWLWVDRTVSQKAPRLEQFQCGGGVCVWWGGQSTVQWSSKAHK